MFLLLHFHITHMYRSQAYNKN